MTTPHHHHWLKPPDGKEGQPPPYGIFVEHPLSTRGEDIDDPDWYQGIVLDFLDGKFHTTEPFGPPCTLPCKDEVWS